MLTTQAPTSECYRHNVYFDLPGAALSRKIETPKFARADVPHVKKNTAEYSAAELALRDTRVDIDKSGRKTLMNEMRVVER